MEEMLKNYVCVDRERYEGLLDCETRIEVLCDCIDKDFDIDIIDVCTILGYKKMANRIKEKRELARKETERWWREQERKEKEKAHENLENND